jgi:hypothetical protein
MLSVLSEAPYLVTDTPMLGPSKRDANCVNALPRPPERRHRD